ncbi:MAG: SOS response-associated peptidase [Verrucomicrobiota bacterium]
MCCRYFLLQDHLREILAAFGLPADAAPPSRYNIAPGTRIPAVRNRPRRLDAPRGPAYELATPDWGLVPSWSKSAAAASRLVNARAESLAAKPSFRDAFQTRRCLIPASGFYEWEVRGRSRRPWLFRRPAARPFCLVGLWETWSAPDGTALETCAVVTTAPNQLMAPIHHRMPAMLAEENLAVWLDPASPLSALAVLFRPPDDTTLIAQRISSRVSNVRHDDPACLAPATDDEADNGPWLFPVDET